MDHDTQHEIETETETETNTLFISKFQPLYFANFEIDPEIIDILNTLIQMDSLNILFIGDIGCGKTSLLNAVIREYYGDMNRDYKENLLHINTLKEQGINYYRMDVKTFCQTCSSASTLMGTGTNTNTNANANANKKKKFVVLDDLDLINEQSQQVFRNYIDKYSHNVHFIASCTNIQKIIESLQSRFTIIKIKPLQLANLHKIIDRIKESEGIVIHPDAEDFVLSVCNNTAKILINYLEKFKLLNTEITLELATKVCTNIAFDVFEIYTAHLKQGELREAIKILYEIYDKGYSVMDILDNYFVFVKVTKNLTEIQKYNCVPIICKYITVFNNVHEDEIELALFTNNLIGVLG